jgi:hypothetical protein
LKKNNFLWNDFIFYICVTKQNNMETIELGNEVVVSDPCYSLPTWCQDVMDDVLPGKYVVEVVKEDWDEWGNRCSKLIVTHIDHIIECKHKRWVKKSTKIGVDSGQCGIFSKESYRNDNHEVIFGDGDVSFFGENNEDGDKWYVKICSHTLGEKRYGLYDRGVVSTSGIGDGVYTLYIKRNEKTKIVSLKIDFDN